MPNEEQNQLNDLVRYVAEQLSNGVSKNKVTEQLIKSGIDSSMASKFVNQVHDHMKESQRKASSKSNILVIIYIIVGFGLLNGVLYVAQEIYHMDDVAAAEAMEAELNERASKIEVMEEQLKAVRAKVGYMESLRDEINTFEVTELNSKVYAKKIQEYNLLIDKWNALQSKRLGLVSDYEHSIKEYNALVERYNRKAQEAYSRWWLLPIPVGRHVDMPAH